MFAVPTPVEMYMDSHLASQQYPHGHYLPPSQDSEKRTIFGGKTQSQLLSAIQFAAKNHPQGYLFPPCNLI
ncbi:unnamed protein product [Meloidogyne enterolobii]|uniref:Uncharacterized protein n=1 Tax=Meloidogyne enterolobii TaxID=390850 RepID=A0ACB0YEC5_MELEN